MWRDKKDSRFLILFIFSFIKRGTCEFFLLQRRWIMIKNYANYFFIDMFLQEIYFWFRIMNIESSHFTGLSRRFYFWLIKRSSSIYRYFKQFNQWTEKGRWIIRFFLRESSLLGWGFALESEGCWFKLEWAPGRV